MSKIWEIDFTRFNTATPPLPLDNVGSGNCRWAVGGQSGMRLVSPGTGFLNRPTRQTERNSAYLGYSFDYETSYVACSGNFTGSYTQRSWVCWFNKNGSTESNGGTHGLYHERNGNTAAINGFCLQGGSSGSGKVRFRVNNTDVYLGTSDITDNTWHMVAMTVDKSVPVTKCYYDGVLVGSGSTVPGSTYSNVIPPLETVVGVTSSSSEVDCMFGYTAAFDNVLSAASISGMYGSFLTDSITGDDPIYTITGTVLSLSNTPVSGAPIFLLNSNDLQLAGKTVATSSGTYSLNIPYAGNYILVTSSIPPLRGARGVSLVASGTAASGSITFYD